MPIFIVLLIIIIFAFGLVFYSWYTIHSLLGHHFPSDQTMKKFILPHEEVTLITADNQTLSAWYISVKDPRAVVILIHGLGTQNGGGKLQMLGHAKYLTAAGYSVMLVDLRGFGESSGNNTTVGIKEWQDISAAYDYLKHLPENRNKKIGYLGISLGATVAIITAAKTGKGDFIVVSVPVPGFDTKFRYEIAQRKLPQFLFIPATKIAATIELGPGYENYSPEKLIKKVSVPILIIDGEKDAGINREARKYLYDQANQLKEFWLAPAGHDVFDDLPQDFTSHVLNFLKKYS